MIANCAVRFHQSQNLLLIPTVWRREHGLTDGAAPFSSSGLGASVAYGAERGEPRDRHQQQYPCMNNTEA